MLCQWMQPVKTVEDENKPWRVTDDEPTSNDVFILFLPTGKIGKETARALAGKEVATGDVYGYMGKQPFVPSIEDTVKRGSKTLRVLAIESLAPADEDQVILHIISFAE